MSEHRQQPWEILDPIDALIEAAKLNQSILDDFAETPAELSAQLATVALSLSTYAFALVRWDSVPEIAIDGLDLTDDGADR